MSTSDSPRGKKAKGGRPRRYMIVPVGMLGGFFGADLFLLGCLVFACFEQQWRSALEGRGIQVDGSVPGLFIALSPFLLLVLVAVLGGRWIGAEAWLTIDEKGMTLVGWSVKRRTISWSQPIKVRRWVSHYWASEALTVWEFSQGDARITLSLRAYRGIFQPDQDMPDGSLFRSDKGFLLPFPGRDAKTLELIKRLGDLHFVDEE